MKINHRIIKSLKNFRPLNYVLLLMLIFTYTKAQSKESFPLKEVWNQVEQNSNLIKANEYELEASQLEKDRASRHWLPRVYLDVKSYQTNDPGNSFFGLLEQKALRNDDFNAEFINHPPSSNFLRGALGVDLSLYEGGFKTQYHELMNLQEQLKVAEKRQNTIKLYAQVFKFYSQVGVLEVQTEKLARLNSQIEKITQNYQLGNKANPVGYSGLLGLKSLSLKIKAMLANNTSQSEGLKTSLFELGFQEKKWKTEITDILVFMKNLFPHSGQIADSTNSLQLENVKIKKQMSETQVKLENSRFLPRLGLFAESYAFQGNRDNSSGYTAGVYLMWNLFRADDYGIKKEAQVKTLAAEKYYLAQKELDSAEIKTKRILVESLKENLSLLNQSEELLNEQSKVTEGLFRNGSINVLQFVELLNRKVDLLLQQQDISSKIIEMTSENLSKLNRVE